MPRFKRGVDPITSSLASFYNTTAHIMTNDDNIRHQSQENQKQRDFAAEEAQKQRDWQSSEWQRQYDQQRAEYYKQLEAQYGAQWQQFQREAEYNSPANQVARLHEAGLNASAIMGGTGSSGLISAASGSLSSPGSPSVPTGGTVSGAAASAPPTAPVGIAHAPTFDLTSLGSFLRDVSEANKNNLLSPANLELINNQIENVISDTAGKKLVNEAQVITNSIARATKDYKIAQEWLDLQLTAVDILRDASQGRMYDANAFYYGCAGLLAKMQKKLTKQQYLHEKLKVDNFMDDFSATLDVKRSESSKNRAQAREAVSVAETNEQLLSFRTENAKLINELQRYQNELTDYDRRLRGENFTQEVRTNLEELLGRAQRAGLINQELQQSIDLAKKNNDWYTVNLLLKAAGVLSGSFDKTMHGAKQGADLLK